MGNEPAKIVERWRETCENRKVGIDWRGHYTYSIVQDWHVKILKKGTQYLMTISREPLEMIMLKNKETSVSCLLEYI